jgi:hypothetical protein
MQMPPPWQQQQQQSSKTASGPATQQSTMGYTDRGFAIRSYGYIERSCELQRQR